VNIKIHEKSAEIKALKMGMKKAKHADTIAVTYCFCGRMQVSVLVMQREHEGLPKAGYRNQK
jgi:hypothetical protein